MTSTGALNQMLRIPNNKMSLISNIRPISFINGFFRNSKGPGMMGTRRDGGIVPTAKTANLDSDQYSRLRRERRNVTLGQRQRSLMPGARTSASVEGNDLPWRYPRVSRKIRPPGF